MGREIAADTLSRQSASRFGLRRALSPDEWLRLGSMTAVIIALHVIGWGTLVLVVEPAHFSVGDKAFGIGIGLPPTRWGCATHSTPTTSPRSTTPPAN